MRASYSIVAINSSSIMKRAYKNTNAALSENQVQEREF